MADPPRREPPLDPEDETRVVRSDDPAVVDEWGTDTYVEQDEVVEEAPRRAPLVWPWLLLLLLLVLGGLGAYWYFSQEDESTVPVVVGHRQQAAEAEVRAAGFDPETRREESEKPRGFVLAQDPEGGTELEEGENVVLTVSAGPPRETVPDVVGERSAEAIADVEAAGFDTDVTQVFSQERRGTVVEQDPEGGTNAEEGATVELSVSKGARPVVVPDVVGTTSSEATATLRGAGLKVNLVSVPSNEAAGTVIAQNPRAGATARQGTTVRLNVAKKPTETTPTTTAPTTTAPPRVVPPPPTTPGTTQAAKATAPDVVGRELADGARAFGDEGLKVDVRYVPSQEPQGRVVAQARPAGTELDRGSTVQLNVSNGPNPQAAASVPDVTGVALRDARARLESAGFEVLAIDLSGRDRSGDVLSQTPRGGASIPRGSLVVLYVGD
ncbi:MAG: PASTA domain-containing protein [Actinobacteria bacterium]|nr:PASTA domain-containing protein [Actinomycetota bacterium]